jgi:hypothetical protein
VNANVSSQIPGNQWPLASAPTQYEEFRPVSQSSAFLLDPKRGLATLANMEWQIADSEAEHQAALDKVRQDFVMPADSSVACFLTAHRTILQLLLEAVPELRTCFGSESVFDLRAPVDESGSQMLYAVARWPGSVSDVRQALAKFDTWWIAHSRQASGNLAFTYELV